MALAGQGVDVIRMMPLYGVVDRDKYGLKPCDVELRVPLGNTWHDGAVWQQEHKNVTTYFIQSAEFFDRHGIYGPDYADNFERFLFFQKAVVALIDALEIQPDLVHCNDWQTGLIPMLLYHGIDGNLRNGSEKTLFTIHNLSHQGWAPAEKFHMTQLPDRCYTMHTLEFYGEINTLKGGLVAASAINAVSPTYAEEIKTPKFGCRLDGVLLHRKSVLHGILNGVDYERWNPLADPYIAANYSIDDIAGKTECKRALQKKAGFKADAETPLLGIITRLVPQKGMDLLNQAIERIVGTGSQVVLLGMGDERYETAFYEWTERWPEQVCSWIEFSSEKAHWIEAGADIYLMPSEFEPCGQNQMYSMRYGTIPVVHAIGGLEDSVVDYADEGGTGFKFHGHTVDDFLQCLDRALALFRNKDEWTALIKQAMRQDFSVVHMAKDYIALYKEITKQ